MEEVVSKSSTGQMNKQKDFVKTTQYLKFLLCWLYVVPKQQQRTNEQTNGTMFLCLRICVRFTDESQPVCILTPKRRGSRLSSIVFVDISLSELYVLLNILGCVCKNCTLRSLILLHIYMTRKDRELDLHHGVPSFISLPTFLHILFLPLRIVTGICIF